MLVGDVVNTEKYGTVTIKEVFRSVREMVSHGYAIPTGRNDTGFVVNGKVVCGTRKRFAAAPQEERDRMDLLKGELPIKESEEDDGTPQEELSLF